MSNTEEIEASGLTAGLVEKVARVGEMPLYVVEHVLWYLGDENLGIQPGRFVSSLLLTIDRADAVNRLNLSRVYEDYVYALMAARSVSVEVLRDRVKAAL